MPKKKEVEAPNRAPHRKIMYPEQLPTVYSNHASWVTTPWDITIDFGTLRPEVPTEKGEQPAISIHTRVIMSLQHAKAFAARLHGTVREYEKNFGTVRTEPKAK